MTYLMQFQADITGIRVAVTDEPESTALGAGREAVTGSGGTPYFQPVKAKTFLPRLNEEERQKLLLKWRDYVKHCQAGTRILR